MYSILYAEFALMITVLTASFRINSKSVHNSSGMCAKVILSDEENYFNSTMDVYDGEQFFTKWNELLRGINPVESYTHFEAIPTSPICNFEICTIRSRSEYGSTSCSKYSLKFQVRLMTLSARYDYPISGVRCSCQEKNSGDSENCWFRNPSCSSMKLTRNECGRLFIEPTCNTCKYGYVSMTDGFHEFSSMKYRSVILEDNCELTFSVIRPNRNGSVRITTFNETTDNIQEIADARRNGATITCNCKNATEFVRHSDTTHVPDLDNRQGNEEKKPKSVLPDSSRDPSRISSVRPSDYSKISSNNDISNPDNSTTAESTVFTESTPELSLSYQNIIFPLMGVILGLTLISVTWSFCYRRMYYTCSPFGCSILNSQVKVNATSDVKHNNKNGRSGSVEFKHSLVEHFPSVITNDHYVEVEMQSFPTTNDPTDDDGVHPDPDPPEEQILLAGQADLLENSDQLSEGEQSTATSLNDYISFSTKNTDNNSVTEFLVKRISQDRLEMTESIPLDRGTYGIVTQEQLVIENDQIIDVAVKRLRPDADPNYSDSVLYELSTLTRIGKHENIVELFGCIKLDDEVYIVLELCEQGNLKNYMKKYSTIFLNLLAEDTGQHFLGTNFSTSTLAHWGYGIACGMEYLGTIQVVHIDLAARNVLLNEHLVPKICDFGLSRQLNRLPHYTKTTAEDLLPWKWLALESLHSHHFTVQSDVWAYGITLWEIFSLGNEPYLGIADDHVDLISKLSSGVRMSSPRYCTPTIYEIMLRCWNTLQGLRPSFTELKLFFELEQSRLQEIENGLRRAAVVSNENGMNYILLNSPAEPT